MGELEFISGRRGLQGKEIVKSTLFCKVHYVLYSDIKILRMFPTFVKIKFIVHTEYICPWANVMILERIGAAFFDIRQEIFDFR